VTGDEVGKQAAFARRMGIDIRSWNNYERGHPIPRDQALALSVRTSVSLDYAMKLMPADLTQKINNIREIERMARLIDGAETHHAGATAPLT
jgi:transcriptional regulator with XRE-family HTH domain